jgi:hypothetical protein
VEQAARVEGVEPAVRVVVKRLGGLDAEAISRLFAEAARP